MAGVQGISRYQVYVLQKQGRHPPLEKSEVVLQKVFLSCQGGAYGIGTGGLIVATNFAPVKLDTINPSIYPSIHPSIAPTNNGN